MSKGRSLTPEENERVVAAVRQLMKEASSQKEVAQALKNPDGTSVSQASVNLALHGSPMGVSFARAVAAHLGISFEELVTGASGMPDGARRYKDLYGWAESARQVDAEQMLPRYVIAAAGDCIISLNVKHVDPGLVYDVGMFWLKYTPLAVRQAAERADILAERAKREADEDTHYAALVESDEVSRGSHVANVPVAGTRSAQRHR